MYMERRISTGRAKCKLCGCKIRKGLKVIYAKSYQSSGYCHVRCDKTDIALMEITK